ncbi:hypothetical protein MCEMIH15_02473 [Caulobacteraceae bacterium]
MSDVRDRGEEVVELAWWDPEVLIEANIMPATGLATDYLNVFNEAVMLFGLLGDMPDMIEELRKWEPLSYEQHFARSGFQAKDLAILAYQNADPAIKAPFDALTLETCDLLQQAIAQAERLIQQGAPLDGFIAETTMALKSSIMMLDGLVHGGAAGCAQDDIDALFD